MTSCSSLVVIQFHYSFTMARSAINIINKCRKCKNISEIMFESGYIIGHKVGSGSYATVRFIERIQDAKPFAAKIIEKGKAPKKYLNMFMPRELHIIENLSHDHIVAVKQIIQTDKHVVIIMDYAEKGDLLDYLRTRGIPTERRAKLMFQQIVNAIQYLHENGIVHRDIKCENILIKEDGDVLVSDFGFARSVKGDCRTFCGSVAYASPQVLEGTPYDARKNDVWSLGCILFILVCGRMPYDDTNIKVLMLRQREGLRFPSKLKDKLNIDVKELLINLLEPDEDTRCTAREILQSSWMKNID